jgi:hypothetical protein
MSQKDQINITHKKNLKNSIERDPFSLPAGIHPLSKGETATVTREEKSKAGRVKAILISRHIRLALVDRSIVTIGDSINDEKVVEIRPDQVILKKEGKNDRINHVSVHRLSVKLFYIMASGSRDSSFNF